MLTRITLFMVLGTIIYHSSIFSQHLVKDSYTQDAFLPNRLIVKFESDYQHLCKERTVEIPHVLQELQPLDSYHFKSMFPAYSGEAVRANNPARTSGLHMIYELSYEGNLSSTELVKKLAALEEIAYVEPWYIHELFYQPNDPLTDTLFGVDKQWYLDQVHAREAWDLQRNDTSVIVAVVDAGFSFRHEDMIQNIYINYDDPVDGIDNDNDGYVDNYRGWDLGGDIFNGVGDNDASYKDELESIGQNHGANVAGVIAAGTDNGIGVAGIGFNCKYLPIKASIDTSPTAITHGYQGIIYAIEQGADIVNCSWGSTNFSNFGKDVIDFAFNRGVAIVAACGNSSLDEPYYPAAFNHVLSVANVQRGDVLAASSTYNYSVDLSAPGTSILGPVNHVGYNPNTGTSFASPLAAGALAIVRGYFKDMTPIQAVQRMRITADPTESNNEEIYHEKMGFGRINLENALKAAPIPAIRKEVLNVSVDRSPQNIVFPGDTFSLDFTFRNFLAPAKNLRISASIPDDAPYANVINGPLELGSIGTMEIVSLSDLSLSFSVELLDDVPIDYLLPIRLTYTDEESGYIDYEYVQLQVNPGYLNIAVNNINTTITSSGNIGFNDFYLPQSGLGVTYLNFANTLSSGGLVIATSPSQVSSNVGSAIDKEFVPVASASVDKFNGLADFEATTSFSDSLADAPIGIQITQKTYAYSSAPDEDYIIFQFHITNNNNLPLQNLHVGLFADWDIPSDIQQNSSDVNLEKNIAFAFSKDGEYPYYGISLLADEAAHIFATDTRSFSFKDADIYDAISSPTDSNTSRIGVPTPGDINSHLSDDGADIIHFVSTPSTYLAPGETDTIAFALIIEDSVETLLDIRHTAYQKYRCRILGKGPVNPFEKSLSIAQAGEEILFSDNNNNSTAWLWEFGDGGVSTDKKASHTYQQAGNYLVKLTVSNSMCEFTFEDSVNIDILSSTTGHIVPDQINIYPNPTNNTIFIDNPDAQRIHQISIMDLTGRTIYDQETTNPSQATKHRLDVSGLPEGFYILNVKFDDRNLTRKIHIK